MSLTSSSIASNLSQALKGKNKMDTLKRAVETGKKIKKGADTALNAGTALKANPYVARVNNAAALLDNLGGNQSNMRQDVKDWADPAQQVFDKIPVVGGLTDAVTDTIGNVVQGVDSFAQKAGQTIDDFVGLFTKDKPPPTPVYVFYGTDKRDGIGLKIPYKIDAEKFEKDRRKTLDKIQKLAQSGKKYGSEMIGPYPVYWALGVDGKLHIFDGYWNNIQEIRRRGGKWAKYNGYDLGHDKKSDIENDLIKPEHKKWKKFIEKQAKLRNKRESTKVNRQNAKNLAKTDSGKFIRNVYNFISATYPSRKQLKNDAYPLEAEIGKAGRGNSYIGRRRTFEKYIVDNNYVSADDKKLIKKLGRDYEKYAGSLEY